MASKQLLHLGFHKTGTTGLQRFVFMQSDYKYFGVGQQGETPRRRDVLADLRGGNSKSLKRVAKGRAVISDESGFLRLGGMAGLKTWLSDVRKALPSPHLVITVRKQEDLLVSAYFHTLAMRQSFLGFPTIEAARGNAPDLAETVNFAQWWEALKQSQDISMAGLMQYAALTEVIHSVLGPQSVTLLPLEWVRDRPADYGARLMSLGFAPKVVQDFLAAPAVNAAQDRDRPLLRDKPNLDRSDPVFDDISAFYATQWFPDDRA